MFPMKKQAAVKEISNPISMNSPEPLRYFYHPDHIGSTSWVTDSAKNGIQYCEYLPYGEPFIDQRSTTWNSRYTFSGKERDGETGYSYFGARYYNSDISIWLSVDPLSDKYPNLTPYAYCANNPVKLVDPNGMEWETTEDQNKANTLIETATKQKESKQQELNGLQDIAKPTNNQKEQISSLKKEIEYLDQGIENITNMGNDQNETYHFKEVTGDGAVVKRDNGVLDIEYSNNAMAWHETVHIGDYRSSPSEWGFDNNSYLGTSEANFSKSEMKAYRSQFSFDNNSLQYSNGTHVSKLSYVRDWVLFHNFDKR